MSEKKFVLGPKQKKWLKALRSGKYEQGESQLRTYLEGGGVAYCCLGVADEVCSMNERSSDILKWTYYQLGLRTEKGMFKGLTLTGPNGHESESLVEANDDGRCSFLEIASFIEKNPEAVFTESK